MPQKAVGVIPILIADKCIFQLRYLSFCAHRPDARGTRRVILNALHPQCCTIAANQPNEAKIAAVIRRH